MSRTLQTRWHAVYASRRPVARMLTLATVLTAAPHAGATSIEDFVSEGLRNISDTPVQSAMGTVVGQICPSGTIITNSDLQDRCNEIAVGALVLGNDIPGARAGLQAMGAEEDAAVGSTQVDARSAHNEAVGQRLTALHAGAAATGLVEQTGKGFTWSGGAAGDVRSPWGFFVNGLYTSSDRDATAREVGFDADEYGVTAGVDYSFGDEVVVGAAFGYKNSDADLKANSGKLETDSYSFIGYWSLYPDQNWYVDGLFSYTDGNHDQQRNVIYNIAALGGGTTVVNNRALSNTDSEEWAISLQTGRDVALGSWVATPLARIEYAETDIDGYTERMSNAGIGSGLALAIDQQHFDSLMFAVGARLTTQWKTSVATVVPELSAEYVHEFMNDNDPITGRFVNDSSRTSFFLLTDSPDRDFFNVGAGLVAAFSDTTSGFVRYQGMFGYRNLDLHAVEVGVRLSF